MRRTSLRILGIGALAGAAGLSVAPHAFAWFWSTPSWPELKQRIRAEYPGLAQLTLAQVRQALESGEKWQLVDVRSPPEFAVSHLLNAQSITSAAQIAKAFGANKQQSILVYCSVGWRSAKIASELKQQGFTRVFNFEGSLFEWANEGLPVYQGAKKVQQVHAYDKSWATLLKPELRTGI